MILYNRPTLKLLNTDIIKLLDDKFRIYVKANLATAGLAELIGVLCDCQGMKTDNMHQDCAGLFCQKEKIITIHPDYSYDDTIFHEISHAWQTEFRFVDGEKSFAATVHLEQQANSMAKYFFQIVHPGKYGSFDTYFNKESIDWLASYWGKWREYDLE